jgi:nicotinamidase/pyrazinamidase
MPGQSSNTPYLTIQQEALEQAESMAPSSEDEFKIALILVDCQIDFCHPEGNLYIQGAQENTHHIASFIYKNIDKITTIVATSDSHLPNHIFFAPWWINELGEHPEPYTIITSEDIEKRRWIPSIDPNSSKEYVKLLEKNGKKNLCIWPPHCIIGTWGQMFMPEISEAIYYHTLARTTNPIFIDKGTTALTEYYGIFLPEIAVNNHYQVEINKKLFDLLTAHDRLYFAGQARSHCVLESLKQLAKYCTNNTQGFFNNVYLLDDCCSVIKHPTIDFSAVSKAEFAKLKEQGLHIVSSVEQLNL